MPCLNGIDVDRVTDLVLQAERREVRDALRTGAPDHRAASVVGGVAELAAQPFDASAGTPSRSGRRAASSRARSSSPASERSGTRTGIAVEQQVLVVELGGEVGDVEAVPTEQPRHRAEAEVAAVLVVDVPERDLFEDTRRHRAARTARRCRGSGSSARSCRRNRRRARCARACGGTRWRRPRGAEYFSP